MIKVLLFAGIAEKIGQAQIEIENNDLTVEQLVQYLANEYPIIENELPNAMIAINEEFVNETTIVKSNDVVAVIPPVSGG